MRNDRKRETQLNKLSMLMTEKKVQLVRRAMKKEAGIDGILVTVGLCIIALLLCVVMKNSMSGFIQTIITAMTTEAQKILSGVVGVIL